MKAQNERLLTWLKGGYAINPMTALKTLGIFRLAARINDIQDRVEIQRGWIEVTNKFGETCRVREYWIDKQAGQL
jgi:hypothetical protein